MPIPLAVIGPGRVGAALARRWHESGLRFLGFGARDAARARAACDFVGAGEWIGDPATLHRAAVVVLAVTDAALVEAVRELVERGAVRSCALWVHTSGLHGLDVLAPIARAGGRVGALHPVSPFPDREAGYRLLPGRHALIEGPDEACRLLRRLAEAAGLRAIEAAHVDRALYHAACALAANGTTGLLGACTRLFARAASIPHDAAGRLAADLAGAAALLTSERGARAALSGPVRRGEADVVERHRRALHAADGEKVEDAYLALMTLALHLAREAGLDETRAAAIARALAEVGDG